MFNLRYYSTIILLLGELSGNSQGGDKNNEQPTQVGVVSGWTPTDDSINQDVVWLPQHIRLKWEDSTDEVVTKECYEYNYLSKTSHRLVVKTKDGGFEIENFGVESCTPQHPVRMTAKKTADMKGYEYTLRFRDGNDLLCYQKKYTTETTELMAKITRSSEYKIDCTPELGLGADGNEIKLLSWSLKGSFDKDFPSDYKNILSETPIKGPCQEIKIICWMHKKENTPFKGQLVADIVEKEHVRLDRLKVTSCSNTLETTVMCKKRSCKNKICNYDINFINNYGKCIKRSYEVVEYSGNTFASNPQYLLKRKSLGDWPTVECETKRSAKGIIHLVKKKVGATKGKTFSS